MKICSSSADDAEARKPGDDAEEPEAGRCRNLVADIGAEEIERAMRQIDVAHQPEDERESAGDQEIKSRQGHAVEDRMTNAFLAPDAEWRPARSQARRAKNSPKRPRRLAKEAPNERSDLPRRSRPAPGLLRIALMPSFAGAARSSSAPCGICRPS